MAMLIKNRAHKAVAFAFTSPAIAPNGVGGMPTNEKCYILSVGEYNLILPASEWKAIQANFAQLEASAR